MIGKKLPPNMNGIFIPHQEVCFHATAYEGVHVKSFQLAGSPPCWCSGRTNNGFQVQPLEQERVLVQEEVFVQNQVLNQDLVRTSSWMLIVACF